MPTVYLETTIISYLAAHPSRDLAIAGHRRITHDYLVTWNCAHIANGEMIRRLLKVNAELNRFTPLIVTPEAVLEPLEGEEP